jgi:hypothetical protein
MRIRIVLRALELGIWGRHLWFRPLSETLYLLKATPGFVKYSKA